MDYLPIFLDIRGRNILVDGGATAAARRIERALSAGGNVACFDPDPREEVRRLHGREGFTFHSRLPTLDDVKECSVVFGASEDDERDTALFEWTRITGALCNVADVTDKCDFITPSIVDRSPIVVAISTGGTAPVIARILRARIETTLPAAYGELAKFVSGFRARIFGAITDGRERRHFWERLIDGPIGDLFLNGKEDAAHAQFERALSAQTHASPREIGEVFLVGAGPGDPDLLTFRALRMMQRADVVLYDRLIGDEILSLVRRDAQRIYVGKLPKEHTMSQGDIGALMVKLANEGNRVLRLKGGDPFMFGRGGEEIDILAEAGIRFQVAPGITAAIGCGAYAGIPLTHRDHAQSCLFVTAHGKNGVLELDWDVMVRPAQTVVVYMGLSNIAALVDGLVAHGMTSDLPIAVVENGTRTNQRVVTGTLATIQAQLQDAGVDGPSVIIIGGVVNARRDMTGSDQKARDYQMSLTASHRI